ncbi:MAG: hypothetical protein M1474_03675 [Candidatus Marsarchaeota archaeon]|jgi:copper homeostasis protein CutC|nr:hypothetical protein [Candidatus Marsarchaeota archaeon]
MAQAETFTVSRADIRRILVVSGVSEKNIASLFSSMEKAHRHINIIAFASLLEKAGVDRDKMTNVFRRIGMDDVTIRRTFDMVDEERISSETGRIYDATIEF